MGSLFSTKPQPAPPPPPPSGFRDEINNVEQVPVTNPDGSITYISRELPLSAEEQANRDQLNQIRDDALNEISKLSSADYTPDADTQNILDIWETERREQLADDLALRKEQEEQNLARRGLSDSSTGRDIRRQRSLDAQEASKNIDRETSLLAADIRNERLANQQNLFGIVSNETNSQRALQQQSAARGLSASISVTNAERASVLDSFRAGVGRSSQPTLFGEVFTAGLSATGQAFGGEAGASLGQSFGNSLTTR